MLFTTLPARQDSRVSPTLSIKITNSPYRQPHISRVRSTSCPEARLLVQALRSGAQQGPVDTINQLTIWRAHSTLTPSLPTQGPWVHRSLRPLTPSIPPAQASINLILCNPPPRRAPTPPPPQPPNPTRKCSTAVWVGMSPSGLTRSLILPPTLADRQCGQQTPY